jgi:hypothetical protein
MYGIAFNFNFFVTEITIGAKIIIAGILLIKTVKKKAK